MNGTVYRIWNTNTNRWVRSNNGLSMWQKLSGARNTINQNSYLKGHCVIKEFMIIPKDEVVNWSSNEHLITEEMQENHWNLFGERFDKELNRIIPDYSRENAKMVYRRLIQCSHLTRDTIPKELAVSRLPQSNILVAQSAARHFSLMGAWSGVHSLAQAQRRLATLASASIATSRGVKQRLCG